MMRKAAAVLSLLALAALAGCETEGPGPVGPPPVQHYAPPPPPPPPPTATILGHGFYRTRAGSRGECTGLSVLLMHDTPSYHRRMVAIYGPAEGARLPIATAQARTAKLGQVEGAPMAASVQCDGRSEFAFRDVSPGSYFIIGRVRQTPVSGAVADYAVMRHLQVSVGEVRDISLAP